MNTPCTRMYTHPFFEATPMGAAPGPPVNTGPVFATSGDVIFFYVRNIHLTAKPCVCERVRIFARHSSVLALALVLVLICEVQTAAIRERR